MMLSDIYNYQGVPKLLWSQALIAHHIMSVIPSSVNVWTNCRGLICLILLKAVGEVGTFLYSFAALKPDSRTRVGFYRYGMTLSNFGMLVAWCGMIYASGWGQVQKVIIWTPGVVALCWGRQECMMSTVKKWREEREVLKRGEKGCKVSSNPMSMGTFFRRHRYIENGCLVCRVCASRLVTHA